MVRTVIDIDEAAPKFAMQELGTTTKVDMPNEARVAGQRLRRTSGRVDRDALLVEQFERGAAGLRAWSARGREVSMPSWWTRAHGSGSGRRRSLFGPAVLDDGLIATARCSGSAVDGKVARRGSR